MEPHSHADPVEVRYYPHDGSIFLDTHYLIKGVAGAIFWKLAREHSHPRRQEFTTRELRLAGRELRLPELQDNLSVRLLLLQRRLAERAAPMQIGKIGRGRFRVLLLRPLRLIEAPAHGTAAAALPRSAAREAPGLAPRVSGREAGNATGSATLRILSLSGTSAPTAALTTTLTAPPTSAPP
jgi:hypothetical protein